jgi:ribulose-5-phosphate 4-epimerase/fuculose-1-phosphate aldolase
MTTLAPTSTADAVAQARTDLAAAFRAAALHGYNEGIDNHFSLAQPGRDDRFLLNRYGPHWSEMRASDLLVVDVEGNVVEGEGEWETTAFMIHRGVHQARSDAHCVLHTHMPYATAVSLTRGGFDTRVSQNSMYFHGKVARLPYGGLADATEEGMRIGAAVGEDVSVVFLDNHGVIVIGRDVADAWHKLYFLERACEVQVLAQSTGDELVRVPEDVATHTARQWEREAAGAGPGALFDAVKRRLDRESPGYAS